MFMYSNRLVRPAARHQRAGAGAHGRAPAAIMINSIITISIVTTTTTTTITTIISSIIIIIIIMRSCCGSTRHSAQCRWP